MRHVKRCPDFPQDHFLVGDFFTHEGAYDRILEQTVRREEARAGSKLDRVAAQTTEKTPPQGAPVASDAVANSGVLSSCS